MVASISIPRAAWRVAGTWTYASDVAVVDFTGLGIYDELIVQLAAVTASSSDVRYLRVSIDNGANFLTTSGDYLKVDNAGVETAGVAIDFFAGASASARGGIMWLAGLKSAQHKPAFPITGGAGRYRIATTSPVNAIRIFHSGGNLTGGSIVVFGR